MRRWASARACRSIAAPLLAACLIPLLARAQTAPGQARLPAWAALDSAAAAVLASHRPQLDAELNFYNYPPSGAGWTVFRLVSDRLDTWVVFQFQSASGPADAFVAAVSSEPAGPVLVVPLSHRGESAGAVESDPYTYAAFNRTLARERPLPDSPGGWVEWAVDYLLMTGSKLELITSSNAQQYIGGGSRAWTYEPYVFAETNGWTGVRLYLGQGGGRNGEVTEYGLEFDANGLLRNLIPVHGTRALPPQPLGGGQ